MKKAIRKVLKMELLQADVKVKALMKIENLNKIFVIGTLKRKYVHAINDLSLDIGYKEVVALVGESGSGKTTVARVISKLYRPTSGKIYLEGEEVGKKMRRSALLDYRKKVQMIFQDPFSSLNPLYPASYAVLRPLKVHRIANSKKEREEMAKNVLEECGLMPAENFLSRYPYELSGGQRQRLGIARALATRPKLVLADEPTSMLDVSIRLDIMNLMLDLKEKEGISYLFITHDLAGAHYMADRIAIMYAGHLMEIGPSDNVINFPKHPYTQLLKKAAPKPEADLEPEKIEVGGEVPDLTNLPKGCPFEPRCLFARPECKEGLPKMVKVGENHYVRCLLYKEE